METRNFFEYYKTLTQKEKRKFANEVSEICDISHATFFTWVSRKLIPLSKRNLIELHFKDKEQIHFNFDPQTLPA